MFNSCPHKTNIANCEICTKTNLSTEQPVELSDSLMKVLKKLHVWVTQEPSQPSSPDAQQWVRHYVEEAMSMASLIERAPKRESVAFDESALVAKALEMYGMIDIEQMYRTVKAMRELKMSPYCVTIQIEGGA